MRANSLKRTSEEIAELYERHYEMVYRVCFIHTKNAADAEDATQDAFVNLIKMGCTLESVEHEKAWLIRTASNICKNKLKHWWRKRKNLEDCAGLPGISPFQTDETLTLVLNMPDKYKSVVYLHYYEGYKTAEIAELLRKPQSTVRNILRDARIILKKEIKNNDEQ